MLLEAVEEYRRAFHPDMTLAEAAVAFAADMLLATTPDPTAAAEVLRYAKAQHDIEVAEGKLPPPLPGAISAHRLVERIVSEYDQKLLADRESEDL